MDFSVGRFPLFSEKYWANLLSLCSCFTGRSPKVLGGLLQLHFLSKLQNKFFHLVIARTSTLILFETLKKKRHTCKSYLQNFFEKIKYLKNEKNIKKKSLLKIKKYFLNISKMFTWSMFPPQGLAAQWSSWMSHHLK